MQREDLKNLLNSFKKEDFYKNVDLHIHSNNSDGEMSPEQIIEQAQTQNMKYISICDHNCVDAYSNNEILSNPIIIPSVEFDCFYKGVLIHILGYGIDVNNSDLAKLYADNKNDKTCNFHRILKLRNPKDVIETIKNAGGVPVLAHPCCYWAINLDKFISGLVKLGLEGLEVYYKYKGARGVVKFHHCGTVLKIAEKYNLIKTGGTDSHGMKLLK
ncbi:PHP domain-containing protein [bacterium]|nr:PHP domain-containing protein [bacterium]